MVKIGEITAVNGKQLQVTFCRDGDCGHCHACDGKANTPMTILVEGQGCIGDYAAVELPTATVTRAALWAYALPIGGLMGGALLCSTLFHGNAAAAVGGIAGLSLAIAIVKLTERRRQTSPAWKPVLQQIIPRTLDADESKEK